MSGGPISSNGGGHVELSVWDDPVAAPPAAQQLRVLTLNCWGLWIVAKKRAQRMRDIAKYVRSTSADLVLLQEVFLQSDADALIAGGARGHLKYSQRFRGGVLGGELLTLSRYPVILAHFEPFHVSGNAAAVWHGDFYAGKGIGHARIDTPSGIVDVYSTHTHASYSHKYQTEKTGQPWRVPADADASARLAQIAQLADYISLTAEHHVVVGGDLNAPPDTLEIELFRMLLPALRDAWNELHPDEPGYTSNSHENSLSNKSADPQMRIDYLWTTMKPLACSIFDKKGADGVSFSDHMGVAAVLGMRNTEQPPQLAYGRGQPVTRGEAPLVTAVDLMLQGRRQYVAWKDAFVALSAACLVVGLTCLGFVIAQPWWNYPGAVLVVLAILQAGALVLVPLLFIIGFAGFGSMGHSLAQAASELQLLLRRGRDGSRAQT